MSFDKSALRTDLKNKLVPPVSGKENMKDHLTAVFQVDPAKSLRTGRTAAEKTQAQQSLLIAKQAQAEDIRLAEAESEIAERKALTKIRQGGRRSLLKTSESGANNLGGIV